MTTTHYDEPQTLAPGKYLARATEWTWDTGKEKDDGSPGDPCIAIMFRVEDERAGEHNGLSLDRRLYLDDDRADSRGRTPFDRTMEVLRAMGLDGEIPADLSTVDLAIGRVELVTEVNAAGYAAIKFVNVPGAGGRDLRTFAPPQPQQLNPFLAKLNARLKTLNARSNASGTRPAQPTQPTQPTRQQPALARQQPQQSARPAQQTQPTRQAPPQRQAPPRLPQSGGQEFGDDSEIPF